MIVNLKGTVLEKVMQGFKENNFKIGVANGMGFNLENKNEYRLDDYSLSDLEILHGILKSARAINATKIIEGLISSIRDFDNSEIKSLKGFEKLLKEYIDSKSEHKWIFRYDERLEIYIPYFVYNIFYEPEKRDKDGYINQEKVVVEIHTNNYNGFRKSLINFYNSDVVGLNMHNALKNLDILIETEELYSEYLKNHEIYKKRINEHRKMYLADSAVDIKNYYRFSSSGKYSFKEPKKVINHSKERHLSLREKDDGFIWRKSGEYYFERKFLIPIVPIIEAFILDEKKDGLFHINNLQDYVYDKSLKDKLVLPVVHKDLLDILINEESILKGDIIDGKGNGTVILLEGPPGCGKTLTSEVYSEMSEKPLYKISAGELGSDLKSIEENLEKAVNICRELGMIMLLDECETFVRKRGDNILQNSIVTAFLRRIEYFDGILFMASNRINDIDDAILSRCIAAVKYNKPTVEDTKKIWLVLAKQFNISLSNDLVEDLIKAFPNIVGRDIKELLKLTGRYCKGKNKDLDLQSFIDCAQFRYIDVDNSFVENNC